MKARNEPKSLKEVLISTGIAAELEARNSQKIAKNALAEGATFDFVQRITGLDIQTIKSLQTQAN